MQLRDDSFHFLRKNPVDLSRYLPQFLYKDNEFAQIQAALNWEHEHYRLKLIEVARQGFIQTADREGLLDWAKFLKIQPREDTEYLRNLIAQKRLGGVVLTPARFLELMDSFLTHGKSFYRELGENQIEIGFNNGTPINYDDFWAAIFEYLPAHIWLADVNFEWYEDPHNLYVAHLLLQQGKNFYDLRSCFQDSQKLSIVQSEITTGRLKFEHTLHNTEHKLNLRAGFHQLIHGRIHFDCEKFDDTETLEAFERYLRRKWSEFKKNAVIKHYKHYFEDDTDFPDIEDDEPFPIDANFLRLYFNFEGTKAIRSLTLLNPKENLQGADINAVSLVSQNFLLSRKGFFSDKIIKAVYVEVSRIKII